MLEQFGRLAKHSSVYGLSNVLAASVSLVLLPLLTRHLTPGEYGALELVIVTAAQLVGILQLGLGYAVFKFVLRDGSDADNRGRVVTTAYVTVAAFALLVTAVLLLVAGPLAELLLDDVRYRGAISWMLIRAFCEAVAVVPMARLRVREESGKYGALNVGRVLFSIVVVFLILVVFDGGLAAVITAFAVESAVFAVAATFTARADLLKSYSSEALRGMLSFGLPLIPLSLGLTVLALGDRYFLRFFMSLDEVGRYAVGYKVAAALGVAIRAFQVAWPAVLFSAAHREDARRFYSHLLTYLVFVLAMAGLAIAVFSRELVALLAGSEFRGAYVVVPFLALGQLSLGVYYATAVGTNLTGKTYYQTLSVLGGVAVLLGLSWVLVPRFGMVGAAIATASGYVMLATLNCAISLRLYRIHYEWGRIGVLLVSAIGLGLVGVAVATGSLALDVAAKGAIVAAYPLLLYLIRIPSAAERQVIRQLPAALSARRRRTSEAVNPC